MPATNWTPSPTRWSAGCHVGRSACHVHEKARAEMLVADARQALKESAPLDRLRSLTGELQQVYHALAAAGRRAAEAAGGDGSSGGSAGTTT